MKQQPVKNEFTGLEIAVIGMAGRFPAAANIREFWNNLKNGVESIAFFADRELEESGISRSGIGPNYVKAVSVIKDIDYFDASFFGHSPHEARFMDPQVRIFLECAWEALENAGYNPNTYKDEIGLYAGASGHILWEGLAMFSDIASLSEGYSQWLLCDKDYLSSRVSYKLNLKGPAAAIHTACSTSLVAVHMACRTLLLGECKMALAGGITVNGFRHPGYFYQEDMVMSPDGHCRAFDTRAAGTIFGDGAGVVVLKRLKDAMAEGDNIHALVKSSSINNDGSRKMGYTAPSIEGQSEVIRAAHWLARVEPESITYVEAHGTGTQLGDPVEIESLKQAFKTNKKQFCAIGSVKTNVGHLDVAAGIAGFIKTVLALKHRTIPPSLHFETPNPKIDFENSPFYVNTRLKEWKNDKYPLRAGVSSFGIGGTNVHVVLEQAPPDQVQSPDSKPGNRLIVLSARTLTALDNITANLANHLKENPGIHLADTAYTLAVGRKEFNCKAAVVCPTVGEAVEKLSASLPKLNSVISETGGRPVVFMFSGQGSQYVNMGKELYRNLLFFQREMDRCFHILESKIGYHIKHILFPDSPPAEKKENKDEINSMLYSSPIKFIFEYSLAKLMMHWGIQPYALVGHSLGEYTAACLSGVFSLEDALAAVVLRGELMHRLPKGDMISVPLPEDRLQSLLTGELSIAAVNTDSNCIVSGPKSAVDMFENRLREKGYECLHLNVPRAGHSKMMAPISKEFEKGISKIKFNKPQIPYISGLSGKWQTAEEAVDPGYWTRHLQETIRFSDAIKELSEQQPQPVFLQIGPDTGLTLFVNDHAGIDDKNPALNLVRRPKEKLSDTRYLLDKIGQLWIRGAKIDWEKFYSDETRHRIPLPTYPFERLYYRIEGNPNAIGGNLQLANRVITGKRAEIKDWFYIPGWKRSPVPAGGGSSSYKWLFLGVDHEAGSSIGARLIEHLRQEGQDVRAAASPTELANDFSILWEELERTGNLPQKIVHLGFLGADASPAPTLETLDKYLENVFYSILHLVQHLGNQQGKQIKEAIQLVVISSHMHLVGGETVLNPGKALVLGPLLVASRENPMICCRSIDIQPPPTGTWQEEWLTRQLAAELKTDTPDTIIAYRNMHRLVQVYEPVSLEENQPPHSNPPLLRQGGVYLVTGGLGGIGLVLAEHLAHRYEAKLILTGKSWFPLREQWDQWLNTHPFGDRTSKKIRKVKELEEAGAKVLVYSADAADYQEMKRVVDTAEKQSGAVNGVIHCAGLLGTGIIPLKTREMAEKVLSPKVKGTMVLDRIFRDRQLDFLVLCSSISSVLPGVGQVDYFAANAFLDAFAYYKTLAGRTFTLSINWDSWREVGMAVEAAAPVMKEVNHPLLDYHTREEPGKERYVTHFILSRHWVLNEHMTAAGSGVIPGTAFLEMAWAAVENRYSHQPVELREVRFLNPVMVEEKQVKEIITVLNKQGNGFNLQVKSRTILGSDAGVWQNHAAAKIYPLEPGENPRHDLEVIMARCPDRTILPGRKYDEPGEGLLVFGNRWRNLKQVWYGRNQGLALLELDQAYGSDLASYLLHPALLDNATGFLNALINKDIAYLPLSYQRLTIHRRLPRRIYSYSRFIENMETASKEILKYNVTIMDEEGNQCVDIEEFTMLEISAGIIDRIQQGEAGHPEEPVPNGPEQDNSPALGIFPSEGVDAFIRVLEARLPRLVVSTTNLTRLLEQTKTTPTVEQEEPSKEASPGDIGFMATGQARPELDSVYEPPGTGLETRLAAIWQELLGISGLGIHDDFFELGGDSLKALTTIARIHRAFHTRVPLTEFFTHSTIKQLAGYIQDHAEKSQFHGIPLVEEKEYHPLSSSQKRLYILQQLDKESLAYNLPDVFRLEGEIDGNRLENTFIQLIRRHEILRTSFPVINGQPFQRVHSTVPFFLRYLDIGEADSAASQTVEEITRAFFKPFDLSHAPLIRAALVAINRGEHILMVDIHHIIYDGTSMNVLFHEFPALYLGEELPVLPTRFKDYAEWQDHEKKGAAIKNQQAFWLKEFQGEIPLLNLPYDYPRPTLQSSEGSEMVFHLSPGHTRALKSLALKEDATLFMVTTAVYYVFLAKLSGQQDIVIGTPTAGRKHPDLQPLIGMFLNTLALRNQPAGNKTFKEFLKEVKNRTLKAFENQDYPFEDLVEQAVVKRDLSRNPLFDAMFIFHNEVETSTRMSTKEAEDFKLKRYRYQKTTSMVDLNLVGNEHTHQLDFKFEYCTKLFNADSIHGFIACFKRIVRAILQQPGIKISRLDIVSEVEKQQVLETFNRTRLEYPKEKTLQRLFDEQVERTPDHTALVAPLRTKYWTYMTHISYGELNAKSHRLASWLVQKGVKPDNIVGIKMERSLEMVAGILGILKARGAYLPIEPDLPRQRIDFMLKDSSAKILLSDVGEIDKGSGGTEVIDLPSLIAEIRCIEPTHPTHLTHLCYVIYTSGTTGNPKGVMIEHPNLVNFFTAITHRIDAAACHSLLALTTLSFDISILEIFLPLLKGLKVVLADAKEQKDPGLLSTLIITHSIDMMQVTPSHLKLLLSVPGGIKSLGGLDLLLVGGEAFPGDLFSRLKSIYKGKIYNMYGPTETTIWSAVRDLTFANSVDIGSPIANTRIYILNRHHQVQPIGIPGELCISGDGVARGYLNQPELTAEKFDHDLWDYQDEYYRSYKSNMSYIIYHTGDLAKWLPDGNIQFLGRMDQQVKIRGFRIQLEEIRAQLVKHEHIKEAVVTAKTDEEGDRHLAGYIVSAKELDISTLREYLSRELPGYMLPAYFIRMEQIPLTPNGKVDHSALPGIEPLRPALDSPYLAPGTDHEKLMVNTWKQVLKVDRVGINDNFFELGGNSLNIINLNSKINEIFQLDIPVYIMFKYPTINSFLKYLDREESPERISRRELEESRTMLEETAGILNEGEEDDD
jgi:amino acid adenylation domain-containing protein